MNKYAADPVFSEGPGMWYFWDETWAWRHGPYATEELARSKLKKYAIEELGHEEMD